MGRKIGLGRIWSFVLGFRSLVARLVPFERGGTKPEGEKNFGNGKYRELIAPPWWPLREGRDGKCEGRNEKCEFLARESVSSSPIVRIFAKGKCKFIANFSATMVTSLPSLSLSVCLYLSLSLSLSPKVPHAQYRKRFRASYHTYSHPPPPPRRDVLKSALWNGWFAGSGTRAANSNHAVYWSAEHCRKP